MWQELNNKKRNCFDRAIRNYKDIHEWAVITSMFMFFICLPFGFIIYGASYQEYPNLAKFGSVYLICGIISLIMMGVHIVLED